MSDRDDKTEIFLPNAPAKAEPSGVPGDEGAPPPARLVCTDTSKLDDGSPSLEISLSKPEEITLGRGTGNTVTIHSSQLSRQHVRIYPGPGKWGIEDLDSKNGTWVNDATIKQSWLAPGDVVKIGPIPFRYELDRPDVEEQPSFETTIIDKTMLVGSDVRAADALLRAVQKRDAEPDTEPAESAAAAAKANETTDTDVQRRRAQAAQAAAARARPQSSPGKKRALLAGGAVIVLALIGYFAYTSFVHAELQGLVKQYDRELRGFLRDNEQSTQGRSAARAREELAILQDMLQRVNESIAKYPASPALRRIQIELDFLSYERRLDSLLRDSALDDARLQYAKAMQALKEAKAAAGDDAGPEFRDAIKPIEGLYRLSAAIIELRAFRLKYPVASKTAKAVPSAEELANMRRDMDQFALEKRNNNLALSVRYRYFLELAEEVDNTDLRVLNRWREIQ